jgi:hypothetical protein
MSLYNLLEEFCNFEAVIKYSRTRQTFYYITPFVLQIDVKIEKLNNTEYEAINGGGNLNNVYNEEPFHAIKLHGIISYLPL